MQYHILKTTPRQLRSLENVKQKINPKIRMHIIVNIMIVHIVCEMQNAMPLCVTDTVNGRLSQWLNDISLDSEKMFDKYPIRKRCAPPGLRNRW